MKTHQSRLQRLASLEQRQAEQAAGLEVADLGGGWSQLCWGGVALTRPLPHSMLADLEPEGAESHEHV